MLSSPASLQFGRRHFHTEVKELLSDAGINISGEQLSNVRYADDTTLLESSNYGVEHLAKAVKEESLKFGLKMNDSQELTSV